jgi:hypothetical protein
MLMKRRRLLSLVFVSAASEAAAECGSRSNAAPEGRCRPSEVLQPNVSAIAALFEKDVNAMV